VTKLVNKKTYLAGSSTHFFGLHITSLINLKIVSAAFGIGGGTIASIVPPGYAPVHSRLFLVVFAICCVLLSVFFVFLRIFVVYSPSLNTPYKNGIRVLSSNHESFSTI